MSPLAIHCSKRAKSTEDVQTGNCVGVGRWQLFTALSANPQRLLKAKLTHFLPWYELLLLQRSHQTHRCSEAGSTWVSQHGGAGKGGSPAALTEGTGVRTRVWAGRRGTRTPGSRQQPSRAAGRPFRMCGYEPGLWGAVGSQSPAGAPGQGEQPPPVQAGHAGASDKCFKSSGNRLCRKLC